MPVLRVPLTVPTREGGVLDGVLSRPAELALTGEDAVAAPSGARPPLVVVSHGFRSDLTRTQPVADDLAEAGAATYRFTFRGGSAAGDMTGMSVLTEIADLADVIDAALAGSASGEGEWGAVDATRLALVGQSQGGAVSLYTAARRPESVASVVAWYPALCITDDLHRGLGSLDAVGETFTWMGQLLGRRYAADVWDLDVDAELARVTAPTLLVHGTHDPLVPLTWSERAADVIPDARLLRVNGAQHGFHATDLATALVATRAHLARTGIL